MKLTKRKGFNFFRSYYDVYNELENNDDKVAFIDALFDRQFLGCKPDSLKGMSKFAYISQTNSIDTQVKGYEDKTKTRLDGSPYYKEVATPTAPLDEKQSDPTVGGARPPALQVQEKEKEKVQEKEKEEPLYREGDFFTDWNDLRTKHLNKPSHLNSLGSQDAKNAFQEIKANYNQSEIQKAMIGLFKQKKLPNGNTQMQSSPKHFLTHFEPYHTAYYDKNTALYGKIIEA